MMNSKNENAEKVDLPAPTRYVGPQQSFSKLDDSGNPLPDDAPAWSMVRDNDSGLVWEVKTQDEGIHFWKTRYDWEEVRTSFIAKLNEDRFGDSVDWRLPTVQELSGIIDRTKHLPAVDANYFPNTDALDFWAATPDADDARKAWRVHFCRGYVNRMKKSNRYYVRAVRGPINKEARLVDNKNGTFTDATTGLMWIKSPSRPMTWQKAGTYCAKLHKARYTDWRLPSAIEMQSLVDYQFSNPAGNADLLRLKPLKATDFSNVDEPFRAYAIDLRMGFWSSTIYNSNRQAAWVVDFKHGSFWHHNQTNKYPVRAVRSVYKTWQTNGIATNAIK